MRVTWRGRIPHAAALVATGLLLAGCTPQVSDGEWELEAIEWQGAIGRTDVAFGMHELAADGAGGFWAASGGGWLLHVSADGSSEVVSSTQIGDPLTGLSGMAGLSPTQLVLIHDRGAPVLSVLDTTTMTLRDLPGEQPEGTGEPDDLGDWIFADVAVQAQDAIIARYAPDDEAHVGLEVLRVDLDDGARTMLFTEPLLLPAATSASGGLPPVDIDVDGSGVIRIATPGARIVLDADGAELNRTAQEAELPHVAVSPDGTALWWGGGQRASEERGVVTEGSDAAREAIEERSASRSDTAGLGDSLIMIDAQGAQHPLPFLHGANAAVWTGSSWVVAIGGEGGGVLVRLTPPKGQ